MKQLADDLFILDGLPPYAINVYLIGDVLLDAGSRHAARRLRDPARLAAFAAGLAPD
jgi:hydroxyacylglutathione hydrolase